MSGIVVSAANGADRKQWKASYKDETKDGDNEVKDEVKKDTLKQQGLLEIHNASTPTIDEEINKTTVHH